MAQYKIVMVRHGESVWNAENRFCGWVDADLADTGVEEAKKAGEVFFNLYLQLENNYLKSFFQSITSAHPLCTTAFKRKRFQVRRSIHERSEASHQNPLPHPRCP